MREQMSTLDGIKDSLPDDLRWTETNQSELAAFTSYALAFPANFLALVVRCHLFNSNFNSNSNSNSNSPNPVQCR